jgi:hypothetical protein
MAKGKRVDYGNQSVYRYVLDACIKTIVGDIGLAVPGKAMKKPLYYELNKRDISLSMVCL